MAITEGVPPTSLVFARIFCEGGYKGETIALGGSIITMIIIIMMTILIIIIIIIIIIMTIIIIDHVTQLT